MIPKETTRGLVPRIARYLSDAELSVLSSQLRARDLTAGDVLLQSGELNDRLFYIERGELAITLPLDGRTVSLGTRHAGSWVGELGWLEPGPASATVTAVRDSRLLELGREQLLELGRTHPDVGARLLRVVSEDLARRVRNAGVVLESPIQDDGSPGKIKQFFARLFGGGTS